MSTIIYESLATEILNGLLNGPNGPLMPDTLVTQSYLEALYLAGVSEGDEKETMRIPPCAVGTNMNYSINNEPYVFFQIMKADKGLYHIGDTFASVELTKQHVGEKLYNESQADWDGLLYFFNSYFKQRSPSRLVSFIFFTYCAGAWPCGYIGGYHPDDDGKFVAYWPYDVEPEFKDISVEEALANCGIDLAKYDLR